MKIPFKSKLTKFRNIENRNKAFDKLTDRQKRQEIAYDALILLTKGQIIAERGSYWGNDLWNLKNTLHTPKEFQEKLCKLDNTECEVCARGALMLSTIRLGNKLSPKDSNVTCGGENNIKGFDIEDFSKMEIQFEQGGYNSVYSKYDKDQNLGNILCNVIKNGNYKKEDNSDYLKKWEIKL